MQRGQRDDIGGFNMTSHDHEHEHSHVHADGTPCSCESPDANEVSAIDPVCLMTVAKEGAQHIASFEGRQYYFCSAGCRAKFVANPQAYVTSAPPAG